ncbi:MAG: hypothetical protein KDA87_18150 [Planctomycetales bacterium]|nr:hypothetical protein [Planctomycetales bacterium]
MAEKLVTIARYPNAHVAQLIQSHLLAQGIRAHVSGTNVANMLSHVGSALGGVRLQVAADDVEQANQVLLSLQDEGRIAGWLCGRCHEEVDPGFEICWNCQAHRSEFANPLPQTTDSQRTKSPAPLDDTTPPMSQFVPSDEAAGVDTPNPFAPAAIAGEDVGQQPGHEFLAEQQEEVNAMIDRAWRASVLGMMLLPPLLNFYSMYLLMRVAAYDAPPSSKKRILARWTFAVNLASSLMIGVYRWAIG